VDSSRHSSAELPDGATLLASTEQTSNQAFAEGKNIPVLQFHIEAGPALIEQWLLGHTCELSQADIVPSSLRHASNMPPDSILDISSKILKHWLDQTGD
jgi:GMP synthase (glutamine-hydrolysing)